ncbi:MAG: hypothetical protein HQM08_09220 [Candidatus Riflebacteria bacterium]|nr:hypothetical protein [Candidatus Riflebacteria bacterium]
MVFHNTPFDTSFKERIGSDFSSTSVLSLLRLPKPPFMRMAADIPEKICND